MFANSLHQLSDEITDLLVTVGTDGGNVGDHLLSLDRL